MEVAVHEPNRLRLVAAVAIAATCIPYAAVATWMYWRLGYHLAEVPIGVERVMIPVALCLALLPALSTLLLMAEACRENVAMDGPAGKLYLGAAGVLALSLPAALVSMPLAYGLGLFAAVLATMALVAWTSHLLGRLAATSLALVAWVSLCAMGLPVRWEMSGLRAGVWLLLALIALMAIAVALLARGGRGAFTDWRQALRSFEADRVMRASSLAPIAVVSAVAVKAATTMPDPAHTLWLVWLLVALLGLGATLSSKLESRARRIGQWVLAAWAPLGVALLLAG